MLTIPNALTPSEDEYNIAALLSSSSIRKVTEMQVRLSKLLGDVVWTTPSNCLHITLMEVICNTDYGGVPRKQVFSDWYSRYANEVGEIIAQFPSFWLDFNELHISQHAIIIKASDPSPLNDIRSALLSKTKLPVGTKLPPDIGHSTIARFNAAMDVETIKRIAKPLQVKINEQIESFQLIEGLGPPKLSPEQIASYPLKNS